MNTLVILGRIFCSALAHVVLKVGMTRVTQAHEFHSGVAMILRALLSPLVISGLTLHVLALVAWLYALSNVDISYAYPFISLGFGVVLLISFLFLGEHISVVRLTGVILIVIGVIFVSRS